MARLVARVRIEGISPEDYARQLIEDGLALQREAESMTIAQIMAPVRKTSELVDEKKLLELVEKARVDNHPKNASRGKSRICS